MGTRACPYFVQDLVEGEPLDRRLEGAGPLAPGEAASVIRKLAGALHAAHEVGILHRDVKPANVILTPRGEPILIDFGVAKNTALILSKTGLTKTGQGVGSPGYWSPEQACGELDQIDRRSDVYSLGATLYASLVGRAPFEGLGVAGNLMITVNEPPQPPRELRAEVSADLEAICLKCLEKEPERRYATAAKLEQDLGLFLAGEPPLARGGSTPRSRTRARRRRLVATVVAAPVLLGAAVLSLAPSLDVRSPPPEVIFPGGGSITVEILASGLVPVRSVEVNGTPASKTESGVFRATLNPLPEGEHSLSIVAQGLLRSTEASLRVHVDATAPVLSVTSPRDYSVHGNARVTFEGTILDASLVEVFVSGGVPVQVSPGESFSLRARDKISSGFRGGIARPG